jgi:hypothetical protein
MRLKQEAAQPTPSMLVPINSAPVLPALRTDPRMPATVPPNPALGQ